MSSKNPKIGSNQTLTNKSKKTKSSKASIKATTPQLEQPEDTDVTVHLLPTDYIPLRCKNAEKLLSSEKNLIVPHSSPRSSFIYDKYVDTLPEKLNKIDELNVPYVRVLGIRKTIEMLGQFFGCNLYKTSRLQFWFLDMVTDCLWKCQDEFLLNDYLQKCVLRWILYLFDVIRDPMKNLSRGQFFRLFREALVLAEETIQCGDPHFPTPDELFKIAPHSTDHSESDDLCDSSDSSLSFEDDDDDNSDCSFLVMASEENPELPDYYKLPQKECGCDISVTSSLDTLSEKSIHKDSELGSADIHYNSEEDVNIENKFSVSEFYQPEKKIHSRFIDEEDEDSRNDEQVVERISSDMEYEWVYDTKKKRQKTLIDNRKSVVTLASQDISLDISTTGKVRSTSMRSKSKIKRRRSVLEERESTRGMPMRRQKSKVHKEELELDEEDLLKAWFEYNVWEQRRKDMEDPTKGWKPAESEDCAAECICDQIEYTPDDLENDEYVQIKGEWLQYLDKHKLDIDQYTQNVFVNSCLLLIIKQFVFEYFYESFQYKLIKMSYQTTPVLTYEKLNEIWPIPKENRDELKRPAEKIPKPPKPIKEKAPKTKDIKKKEKDEKKSKGTKGSDKKEKQPKVKTEKPSKPTKEEKEEIERLKREERERLLEEKAAEENKRFIFPLELAATEDFFKSIFENYVPPSVRKAKEKDIKKKK